MVAKHMIRLCAAFALLALSSAPAGAEDFDCLWDKLPTSEKARLELASRMSAPSLQTLLERRGEDWLTAHLSQCEFALEQQALIRVAQFLDARAGAEATLALLVAEGLPADAAHAALDAEAKPGGRRALAEEIMNFNRTAAGDGAAVRAVRAVAERMQNGVGGDEKTKARVSLAARSWAIHQIMADGLRAGARPERR